MRYHLLLALAVVPTSRAEDGIDVWGAVVFVANGEHTPFAGPTQPALTPLGASQMYAQGSALRHRYVSNGQPSIQGIEPDALDPTQLSALSDGEGYIAAGAQALLQGLYPPRKGVYAYGTGGAEAATMASTDHALDFPLGGYQYMPIEVASVQSPQSAWVRGERQCSRYQAEAWQVHDANMKSQVYNETRDYYRSLYPLVFAGAFDEHRTHYADAHALYDYAAYQYTHNATVRAALKQSDVDRLHGLAADQQLSLHSDTADPFLAVSGRMLARRAMDHLQANVKTAGATYKLSLTFGSFEPLLAFFGLANLTTSADASDASDAADTSDASALFATLPGPGAVLAFELYSLAADRRISSSSNRPLFPSTKNLHVRLAYRPGTDDDADWGQHNLFTPGTHSMPYNDFAQKMAAIGIDSVAKWCAACDSGALFCTGLLVAEGAVTSDDDDDDDDDGARAACRNYKAYDVLAVIGFAICGCLVPACLLLATGRLRMTLVRSRSPAGPIQRDTDADVNVARDGTRHERVGSWELRAGGGAGTRAGPAGLFVDPFITRPETAYAQRNDSTATLGPHVVPREYV